MAKFITRTIVSTQIVVGELQGTELVAIAKITEEGKIEKEKAIKIAQKAFKGRNVLVLDLIPDDAKYRISVEDFIAAAEKVEDGEEVEESTEDHVA